MQNDSTKKYKYSWTMGDGNRKEGDKIEHCYNEFGSYQVKMDLIDPEADVVIRNELSATAELYPEIHPVIEVIHDELLPSSLRFRCDYDHGDVFAPDNVYWRIDGKYYQGTTVAHAFHAAGVYQIEMGIEKNTELTGVLTACAVKEVTIRETDIWTTKVVAFMDKAREDVKTGPFSRSEVFCLLTSETPRESIIVPINLLMTERPLQENREYEVLLFSGNVFTKSRKLRTHGLTGTEPYAALKDTVSSFVGEALNVLPGFTITKSNKSEWSADEVKRAADVLREYPLFKIEIGSYLHTGSRIDKGVETSVQKAMAVKEMLIQNGVASDRISIASPANNRALINTCSSIPDCNWENKELNGKVEFKITGTTL